METESAEDKVTTWFDITALDILRKKWMALERERLLSLNIKWSVAGIPP